MPKLYLCPYFHGEKKASKNRPARILCEGGTRRCADAQMRRDIAYTFCGGDYRSCQIYQLLCAYYERQMPK